MQALLRRILGRKDQSSQHHVNPVNIMPPERVEDNGHVAGQHRGGVLGAP